MFVCLFKVMKSNFCIFSLQKSGAKKTVVVTELVKEEKVKVYVSDRKKE